MSETQGELSVSTIQAPHQIPPRPNVDDKMRLEAARAVVARMVKSCGIPAEEAEGHAADIAMASKFGAYDGFSFARELEDRHGWDCDMSIAEELDRWSFELHGILFKAQAEWAAAYPQEPAFKAGDIVMWKNERTEIIGVCDRPPHSYRARIVDKPLEHDGWYVVLFEDVSPLPAEAAS